MVSIFYTSALYNRPILEDLMCVGGRVFVTYLISGVILKALEFKILG